MRKVDYETLAKAISHQLDMARVNPALAYNIARAETAKAIAQEFANQANVNKDKFLKACGIDR